MTTIFFPKLIKMLNDGGSFFCKNGTLFIVEVHMKLLVHAVISNTTVHKCDFKSVQILNLAKMHYPYLWVSYYRLNCTQHGKSTKAWSFSHLN